MTTLHEADSESKRESDLGCRCRNERDRRGNHECQIHGRYVAKGWRLMAWETYGDYDLAGYDDGDADLYRLVLTLKGVEVERYTVVKYKLYNPLAHIVDVVFDFEQRQAEINLTAATPPAATTNAPPAPDGNREAGAPSGNSCTSGEERHLGMTAASETGRAQASPDSTPQRCPRCGGVPSFASESTETRTTPCASLVELAAHIRAGLIAAGVIEEGHADCPADDDCVPFATILLKLQAAGVCLPDVIASDSTLPLCDFAAGHGGRLGIRIRAAWCVTGQDGSHLHVCGQHSLPYRTVTNILLCSTPRGHLTPESPAPPVVEGRDRELLAPSTAPPSLSTQPAAPGCSQDAPGIYVIPPHHQEKALWFVRHAAVTLVNGGYDPLSSFGFSVNVHAAQAIEGACKYVGHPGLARLWPADHSRLWVAFVTALAEAVSA